MDLKKKVDQLLQELKLEKFSKVISDGEKLLKKNQDKGYLFNICGLAHQRLNKIETSIIYFNKAISLEPQNLGHTNNLANSFISLCKYKEAEDIFKKILDLDPKNTPALVNYARLKNILLDFKNPSKAFSGAFILGPLISSAFFIKSLGILFI